MKIGHFTLSFVDLAVPVSGLDIEIIRAYDSRDKQPRDSGPSRRMDPRLYLRSFQNAAPRCKAGVIRWRRDGSSPWRMRSWMSCSKASARAK